MFSSLVTLKMATCQVLDTRTDVEILLKLEQHTHITLDPVYINTLQLHWRLQIPISRSYQLTVTNTGRRKGEKKRLAISLINVTRKGTYRFPTAIEYQENPHGHLVPAPLYSFHRKSLQRRKRLNRKIKYIFHINNRNTIFHLLRMIYKIREEIKLFTFYSNSVQAIKCDQFTRSIPTKCHRRSRSVNAWTTTYFKSIIGHKWANWHILYHPFRKNLQRVQLILKIFGAKQLEYLLRSPFSTS